MGHGIGDSLLIEVSQRLRTSLRPGDTVARLGGDEFAILLENVSSVTNVEEITQRMEIALARPYQIQGHEIFTTQSIGIALKSERYEWPEQVIRDADIAMYQAKSKGRARHEFFDTAMHTSIIDRLQLEADLRSAVEHQKGFELHYQPIMDLKTRRLTGFEALVRWNHDSRGTVYPLEFIPLAEETGLIAPLSEWVLRESCRQLRVWQSKYPAQPPLMMSVNISSLVLLKTNLVDLIGSLLHDEQIAHGSLAIEVTESVLMTHTVHVMETMTRLRNLGVQIHIDDFGTGYSSLSYLHNFPVTALKIDRSFIASITGTSENKEIVKTIVALAQNLKLQVIAEGVEQHSQLTAINTLACNFGQGFFFSEPLPAEAVEAWIGPAMKHSA
jgi:predicted signal transduction protein with EAL and GGDEF domain